MRVAGKNVFNELDKKSIRKVYLSKSFKDKSILEYIKENKIKYVVYDNKILCVCFQPGGNVKSKVSNLCHIFRNMDLTQSFASAKCLRSNGCHRLGDLHRGNLSVAFKNPIRNCCNTFGDDNLAGFEIYVYVFCICHGIILRIF